MLLTEEQILQNPYLKKRKLSFSEIAVWTDCQYRHKLQYVDGIYLSGDNPYVCFGSALHNSCEQYVKTKTMDKELAKKTILEGWKVQNYSEQLNWKGENYEPVEDWINSCNLILDDVPKFLDDNFLEWELVEAEEKLHQDIHYMGMSFSGRIDLILKAKTSKGEEKYWLLDWKTSDHGWKDYKRQDFKIRSQLLLYKKFWAEKHNIELSKIEAGFIILKRYLNDPTEQRCELFKIASRDEFLDRAELTMKTVIKTASSGIAFKNKKHCLFCPFNKTEHCDGVDTENWMSANLGIKNK